MMKRYIIKLATAVIFLALCNSAGLYAQTSQFRGVNWADKRDNFQSGVIYLSGLSSSDTYQSASIVAERVIGQFVDLFGSNSVRMPINEATVSTYWDTYTGAIDVALTKGKVILCFWSERSGADVRDMNAFWAMWQTVVDHYGDNPNMYFEVFNEPSHLNKTELCNLYSDWLQKFSSFPQSRVILDGSGLAMNVPDVGSDSRFDNCLLAVHEYSFFGSTSSVAESDWENQIKAFVGKYADRTVCTEWGGPMGPGTKNGVFYDKMDYSQPPTNFFEAYIRGVSNQLRQWQMGSFYWIGLRDNDWYSLTTRSGEGANITLSVNNQSGLDRVQYSWGDYDKLPSIKITQPTITAYTEPATIPFDVEASDPDGSVAHIDFFVNGSGTSMHSEWMAPYGWDWEDVPAGEYTMKAVAYDDQGNTAEDSITIKVNVQQAPFGGTPIEIPGKIEFENFDEGGNGFAYADSTAGNDSEANYRPGEDVDIQVCTDEGDGYNLGWVEAGEWLEYTVNVKTAGKYNILIRAASNGTGKTVSLSSDGTDIATNIAIPDTKGWQTWKDTVVYDINLNAGEQVIRLTVGDQDYINLNYMEFTLQEAPLLLTEGWNLIGCSIEGETKISEALADIWEDVEVVKSMDSFYSKAQPEFLNTLKNLDYGVGYSVKVSNECQLKW